jgi:hypothetical protein
MNIKKQLKYMLLAALLLCLSAGCKRQVQHDVSLEDLVTGMVSV